MPILALMPLPQSGSGNLQQMIVGVTKIDAYSTPRPSRPPFQRNFSVSQMPLPIFKFILQNQEAHVHRTVTVVRWD